MIKFHNEYGKFELKKEKRYNFTVVDIESGEAFPIFNVEIVSETEDGIKIRMGDNIERIEKSVIAHEDLLDD